MSFLKKLKTKVSRKKNIDEVKERISESKDEILIHKYESAMKKSSNSFAKRIKKLTRRKIMIDESYFEELEEILIEADFGAIYTNELIKQLHEEVKINKISDSIVLNDFIVEFLYKKYTTGQTKKENLKNELNLKKGTLNVILVIGVNGVGKTTSIGKLAKKLQLDDYQVSLAAADTFRAGAVKQLEEWSKKTNTNIIVPTREGQDPASVVYVALEEALKNKDDVLIIDTAGRLQNKEHLMKELQKIEKIIISKTGLSPAETLLVLDATTGQNGVVQASSFNDVTKLTGIILTKMDSSSKGGIIIAIKDIFNIPVKLIGLGESLDDLEKFDIDKYLYSLSIDLQEESD